MREKVWEWLLHLGRHESPPTINWNRAISEWALHVTRHVHENLPARHGGLWTPVVLTQWGSSGAFAEHEKVNTIRGVSSMRPSPWNTLLYLVCARTTQGLKVMMRGGGGSHNVLKKSPHATISCSMSFSGIINMLIPKSKTIIVITKIPEETHQRNTDIFDMHWHESPVWFLAVWGDVLKLVCVHFAHLTCSLSQLWSVPEAAASIVQAAGSQHILYKSLGAEQERERDMLFFFFVWERFPFGSIILPVSLNISIWFSFMKPRSRLKWLSLSVFVFRNQTYQVSWTSPLKKGLIFPSDCLYKAVWCVLTAWCLLPAHAILYCTCLID